MRFFSILGFVLGIALMINTDNAAIALFFIVGSVFFFFSSFESNPNGNVRAAAMEVPDAIESAPEVFAGEDMPYIECDTPDISGKLLDHFSDQSALSKHVAHLNDVHRRATEALKKPPERFNADRRKVEAQQIVLSRMADKAAKIARKIETNFPKIKAGTSIVSRPKPIVLPATPKLVKLANLADRHRNFTIASGRAIAQGGAQGGLAGMAFAAAASVAIGVIAFQKQVRAMEEAHGQLSSFLSDSYDELQVLAFAHAELVDVSNEVCRQSKELKELLVWAEQAAKAGRFAPQTSLDDEEISKIASITIYALTARIDASRTV